MKCSSNMITYPKINSIGYIYTLVTVAILMSTKYGRRKTLDVVASSIFFTCRVDMTKNNIIKLTCCHWFSYPYFYCSQNELNTINFFHL